MRHMDPALTPRAGSGPPKPEVSRLPSCRPEGHEEEEPQRYGKNAARWVRADEHLSLREVLSRPDHVIPGIPVFFLVARGTVFRERFLTEEMKRM